MRESESIAEKPQSVLMRSVKLESAPESVAKAQWSTTAGSIVQMQREYGNQYVQRMLNVARKAEGEGDVPAEVEQTIQTARGGGQALDGGVRAQMEPAFGADFGGVRVHADGQADDLNRSLSARAFTTGQDIFFKQGEYNPGSSGGRELLAHELTHVVQQNGDQVQTKLTVGAPGDCYEQEADSVARDVLQQEQQTAQRQVQPEDEEEKMMQAKLLDGLVQHQVEEEKMEEEPLQTKYAGQVQRQGEDESKK